MRQPTVVANPCSAPCLYARLLGSDVSLNPAVAALHATGRWSSARGTVTIGRGSSLAARLLAVLLRLPAEGAGVPAVLDIARHDRHESWSRHFGDSRVVASRQSGTREGRLREQYGPLELVLSVQAENGALVITGRSAAIRVGPLRCALPAAVAPHVDATASGTGRSTVAVGVRIWSVATGLILRYEAELAVAHA